MISFHVEEQKTWQAHWIWSTQAPSNTGVQLTYFRREFEVPFERTCSLIVNVSADTRYRLFLNGESVSVGPCKGNQWTHFYETIDLSEQLNSGTNVLSAKVLYYGTSDKRLLTSAWRSDNGAFLLEGNLQEESGTIIESLHTNSDWYCWQATSYQSRSTDQFAWVGGTENVRGEHIPFGWDQPGFNMHDWYPAESICKAQDKVHGHLTPWQLQERKIPALFERDKRFSRIMRSKGKVGQGSLDAFLKGEELTLIPGSSCEIELDAGELTTAYIELVVSGGKGAVVQILYSECYEYEVKPGEKRKKGIRDDIEGKILTGMEDVYVVFGERSQLDEIYEPFWFRTFRFVRLKIRVGDSPLTMKRFAFRETGYPLEAKSDFACSDPSLLPLWKISLNTIQRCMHETYEDCPFYEQMQYGMDTYLQAMYTFSTAADDRLVKMAIHHFHCSQLPTGILQSRYPSQDPQVIPGFSLYWIMLVYEHYFYFGDIEFMKPYRATIDAVLEWFHQRLTDEGLVAAAPPKYWSFIDWVEEWEPLRGVPLAKLEGPLTVDSLMYAYALDKAAELNRYTNRKDTAEEYSGRSEAVKQAVRQHCWSTEKQMFRDGPDVQQFSQHAQLWSILSETVKADEAVTLAKRMLADESICQVSYAMSFFMFRTLSKMGLYDQVFPMWSRWKEQVKLHMTTWLEDPVQERSECHAWGAVPLYDFPAEILGVKPAAPGYSQIWIEPKLGHLDWASGSAATPHGSVHISWSLDDQRKFKLTAILPKHIAAVIRLPDGTTQHTDGEGEIQLNCEVPRKG